MFYELFNDMNNFFVAIYEPHVECLYSHFAFVTIVKGMHTTISDMLSHAAPRICL